MHNQINLTQLSPTELKALITQSVQEAFQSQQSITSQPQKSMLSIDEAAEYLNLAKPTLYAKTSQLEIPFIKRGKKLYFEIARLEEWLLEGKRKTRAEIEEDAKDFSSKGKGGKI